MSVQVKIAVSTIVERDGKFLMVEEMTDDGLRINQPSGHLEANEHPAAAAVREVLEETKHNVSLTGFVGAYRMSRMDNGAEFLRLCYCGKDDSKVDDSVPDDEDVIRAMWMTFDEIQARRTEWRNPMVGQCIIDSQSAVYPLSVVKAFFI